MRQTLLSLLLFVLLLAACGGEAAPAAPQASTADGNGAAAATRLSADFAGALPVPSQLILGSLRLEETEQAIDAAQAAQLLPLWQAYQTLSNDDTTAAAELTAIINQIQDSMAPGQIAAIAAMRLTTEKAEALIQEEGLVVMGRGAGSGQGSGQSGGFPGGGFPGGMPGGGFPGGMPGGGFPGGGLGGGLGGGAELSPEARATAVAERMAASGANPATLLERAMLGSLIRSLQVKTGEIAAADLADRGFMSRFIEPISAASGVDVETLQAGLDAGHSFAEIIADEGGDMAAATAALRAQFEGFLQGDDLEQRVDQILNETNR